MKIHSLKNNRNKCVEFQEMANGKIRIIGSGVSSKQTTATKAEARNYWKALIAQGYEHTHSYTPCKEPELTFRFQFTSLNKDGSVKSDNAMQFIKADDWDDAYQRISEYLTQVGGRDGRNVKKV